MKKSTHSKIKNAGILFELLSRQVTADILSGKQHSPAISIIREAFKAGSLLNEELKLFQLLTENHTKSEIKAHYLVDAVCNKFKRIDKKQLSHEKFNLIKRIKENYDINTFFRTKIDNYKLYASIARTLQTAHELINPAETVDSRFTIVEHITSQRQKRQPNQNVELEFVNLDTDTRILAYKSLVEKFNKKYSVLTDLQKELLREYVNAVSDTTKLRTLIKHQSKQIKQSLKECASKVDSTVERVKIEEVSKLLTKFDSLKTITESNILQMMLFHELIKEIQ